MRRGIPLVLRVALCLALGLVAWALADLIPGVPPPPVAAVTLGGIALIGLAILPWSRAYRRRTHPADLQRGPTLHATPSGSFVWRPAGEPQPHVGHALPVHSWWELSHAPVYHATVAFDVADEVPADVLKKATQMGISAAARALPGRGKVRAKAAAQDKEGPTTVVRVRLEARGLGADAGWAREAAEAFARGFLAHLARKEHAAERVA